MKKNLFSFILLILSLFSGSLTVWANENQNILKKIEQHSANILASEEDCETVIHNHLEIINYSENFIATLVEKKSIEVTPFEITMLQKILTNRYLHLDIVLKKYESQCVPSLLGTAMAVHDFTELESRALKDAKLRRIILYYTHISKYQLTQLKKQYEYYTSIDMRANLLMRLNDEKINLPTEIEIKEQTYNSAAFYSLSDVALDGTSSILSGATRVWGFISDKLKWRNGRLNKNTYAETILRANLIPLDIIYEKREFTLSNYTIPGHWGHVAVWLGTKEELINLGIWEKEFFAPFRKFVEEGKNIIEVRKNGLNAVALSDFINLDEIAVTRIISAHENAESIMAELTNQIGKKYDFTFNAQSSDKLTCAEFIAFSYGDIKWKQTAALFQVSITPDDLAMLSLYNGSPSEFVLYLKGRPNGKFEDKNFEDWKKIFAKNTKQVSQYK